MQLPPYLLITAQAMRLNIPHQQIQLPPVTIIHVQIRHLGRRPPMRVHVLRRPAARLQQRRRLRREVSRLLRWALLPCFRTCSGQPGSLRR